MPPLTFKWNKQDITVEIDDSTTTDVLKELIYSQTFIPVDRMKILGFGGGAMLKDSDNLQERLKKTKGNAKLQILGTAEGKEIKDVKESEKTKFLEDLTAEEKAKILREKKVDIVPSGLSNLGNTCFANSTLHVLKSVQEFKVGLGNPKSDSQLGMSDASFVSSLKQLLIQLDNTTDTVTPYQFINSMRTRFPMFAQQNNGAYMQQDAEEFLRELLSVVGNVCGPVKVESNNESVVTGGVKRIAIKDASGSASNNSNSVSSQNLVDQLFGFQMKSTYTCIDDENEPIDIKYENNRIFICNLGSDQTPVNHLHEGILGGLQETITKNKTTDGQSAVWTKKAALNDLPPYLFCQIARFGYKAANEVSGVGATRVKHVRKLAFSPTLDVFDYCSSELQEELKIGRLKLREKKEDDDERRARKIAESFGSVEAKANGDSKPGADSEMLVEGGSLNYLVPSELAGIPSGPGWRKEYVNNPKNLPLKDYGTGQYELVGIISHKGRSAEGGHYVSWVRAKKASDEDDEEGEEEAQKMLKELQGGAEAGSEATTENKSTAVAAKKQKPKTSKDSGEDTWYCFDDEEVSPYKYKQITGLGIDLQGGLPDTQIAYVLLYKRSPCVMPEGPCREIEIELKKK